MPHFLAHATIQRASPQGVPALTELVWESRCGIVELRLGRARIHHVRLVVAHFILPILQVADNPARVVTMSEVPLPICTAPATPPLPRHTHERPHSSAAPILDLSPQRTALTPQVTVKSAKLLDFLSLIQQVECVLAWGRSWVCMGCSRRLGSC